MDHSRRARNAAHPRLARRRATPRAGTRSRGGNPTLAPRLPRQPARDAAAPRRRPAGRRSIPSLWEGERLVGAAPLYVKSPFLRRVRLRLGAGPTPTSATASPTTRSSCAPCRSRPPRGARLLADDAAVRARLARALLELARDSTVSSLHVLFPRRGRRAALRAAGMLERSGVQFHWRNAGYARLRRVPRARSRTTSARRSARSAARVAEAGVTLRRRRRGARRPTRLGLLHRVLPAHLPRASLDAVPHARVLRHDRRAHARQRAARDRRARRPADRGGARPLRRATRSTAATGAASSTCPALHFEACYYQAIEFCIERGIALFEGGAQGEHKHARGFLPETTRSFHWLAHPAFNRAVDEFLAREGARISAYVDELNERTPFRDNCTQRRRIAFQCGDCPAPARKSRKTCDLLRVGVGVR